MDGDEPPPRINLVRGLSWATAGLILCSMELLLFAYFIRLRKLDGVIALHPIDWLDSPFPTVPVLYFGIFVGLAAGFPAGTYSIARTAITLLASIIGFSCCWGFFDSWGKGQLQDGILSTASIGCIIWMALITGLIVWYRIATQRELEIGNPASGMMGEGECHEDTDNSRRATQPPGDSDASAGDSTGTHGTDGQR